MGEVSPGSAGAYDWREAIEERKDAKLAREGDEEVSRVEAMRMSKVSEGARGIKRWEFESES